MSSQHRSPQPRRDGATLSVVASQAEPKQPQLQRRPHLCFVAPEAWAALSGDTRVSVIGGAEVQQSLLARLFARRGYRVSMICLDYGQPLRTLVDGVRVVRAHKPDAGLPLLRFLHPRLTSLWRAMAAVDADIYYQRSAGMLTGLVAEFSRLHGKRCIFAGASDSDFQPGRQLIRYGRDRWLFKRGVQRADAVVVQNPGQQRDCLSHFGRVSTVIPSYYELPPNSARTGRGEHVLWVATLRGPKRPELFLELARHLPELSFVMIGGADGAEPDGQAYYEAVRARAATVPNLRFLGFLPLAQAEPWFDRARVVVNTSEFEGMPNVFLQAWARGIPTVAFIDLGARRDGQSIYPVAADLEAALAQVQQLCGDDDHWDRVAARCRDYFADTHGADGVLSRYESVLARLMEPR